MSEPTVLYTEEDGIAVITLNRPDKLNALTNDMVQGIADAVAEAAASVDVGAIVLRGAGGSLTAGYDLSSVNEFSGPTQPDAWDTPYDAPGPEPRPGNWDPVRDYQFMNHNVRRFMSLWECPKPVIAEIAGWAIGGATDLVMCADLLFMADDAHIGYAPSRIYGLPTTMMWIHRLGLEHAKHYLLTGRAIDAPTAHRIGLVSEVHPADQLSTAAEAEARRLATIPANQLALNKLLINQAYENMGLRSTQMLGTFFDGIARHTEEALQWAEDIEQRGLRAVIADRDRPWQDYGQRP
ncbi:MAG: crotonase/enoyl-CoA hydratase family protein [Actinomycetota bacterium]|jgi:enoyl-CoA hydratase|nr:crotonase/enoyl-CoA hydratase family protein [Actinomycetota bacterium]